MNPLQQLITQRLDEQGWSYGDVARRAGMPRSTVHNLATRATLARPPQQETLRKLAEGLDLPLGRVRAAAAEAAGFHVYEDHPDASVEVLIASVEKLSPQDRQHVVALVDSLLHRSAPDPD